MSSLAVASRYVLSLSLGTAGGALFYLLGMPLPWMLGAMLVTLICSVSALPLASPKSARPAMSAIIGVVLGTYFQPELFAQIGEWVFSISALLVFIGIAGAIGVTYFHFVGKMDWKTAYFAGMPGGLIEMVLAADANGADSRRVALVHSTRIFLTIMTLPPLVTWMEGASGPAAERAMVPLSAPSVALVLALAAGGVLVGRVLRLPASNLMGPMLLGAVLNLSGVLQGFAPPTLLVWTAQVVIGTVIGCRFIGVDWRHVLSVVALTGGSIVMLLCLAFGFAILLQAVMGIAVVQGVLAYAPGGVAEMSLVAIALHADAAFVALHHVLRIAVVMAAAPLVFKLLRNRM